MCVYTLLLQSTVSVIDKVLHRNGMSLVFDRFRLPKQTRLA
jgi:hypothetical protein